MTTRWATRRAASTCSPSWERGVEEEKPAGPSPAGAGGQTCAGPGGLQCPAQERQDQRRHAPPCLPADGQVFARQGRARRVAVASRSAEARPRSAVLAEADRARLGEAAR